MHRHRRAALAFWLAFLAGVPCAQAAQQTLDQREQAFVAKGTADDDMQITLAKLALRRSSTPPVRTFAKRLLLDHQALNLKFAKLSTHGSWGHAHGVPAQSIASMQKHLETLKGAAFDRAFVGMMVTEHREVIPAYEVAAHSAPHAAVRAVARQGLPVLRGHLAMAQALLARLTAKPDGDRHAGH